MNFLLLLIASPRFEKMIPEQIRQVYQPVVCLLASFHSVIALLQWWPEQPVVLLLCCGESTDEERGSAQSNAANLWTNHPRKS